MIEQTPPSASASAVNGLPAPFFCRVLAKLADLMVVNGVLAALFCAFAALQARGTSGTGLIPWLVGAHILFFVLYLAVGTSSGRQTLGYRLAGLRVMLAGDVPRAELFARQRVPGWSAWGNEVECDFAL